MRDGSSPTLPRFQEGGVVAQSFPEVEAHPRCFPKPTSTVLLETQVLDFPLVETGSPGNHLLSVKLDSGAPWMACVGPGRVFVSLESWAGVLDIRLAFGPPDGNPR